MLRGEGGFGALGWGMTWGWTESSFGAGVGVLGGVVGVQAKDILEAVLRMWGFAGGVLGALQEGVLGVPGADGWGW